MNRLAQQYKENKYNKAVEDSFDFKFGEYIQKFIDDFDNKLQEAVDSGETLKIKLAKIKIDSKPWTRTYTDHSVEIEEIKYKSKNFEEKRIATVAKPIAKSRTYRGSDTVVTVRGIYSNGILDHESDETPFGWSLDDDSYIERMAITRKDDDAFYPEKQFLRESISHKKLKELYELVLKKGFCPLLQIKGRFVFYDFILEVNPTILASEHPNILPLQKKHAVLRRVNALDYDGAFMMWAVGGLILAVMVLVMISLHETYTSDSVLGTPGAQDISEKIAGVVVIGIPMLIWHFLTNLFKVIFVLVSSFYIFGYFGKMLVFFKERKLLSTLEQYDKKTGKDFIKDSIYKKLKELAFNPTYLVAKIITAPILIFGYINFSFGDWFAIILASVIVGIASLFISNRFCICEFKPFLYTFLVLSIYNIIALI